jgi:rsbT antagonist protein RsbS
LNSLDEGSSEVFIPLMRLSHCLFVIVPSELRDTQARELQEAVARRLANERGIRGLVIDVSTAGLLDSFGAKVLGDTANIARSFGAKAIMVGIRPSVAITLVELGIDLSMVETAMTLEAALKKLHLKIVVEASAS